MSKPLILVCEDELNLQKGIRLMLESDYDVVTANDGEEALVLFRQRPPDLVLLDIKLPKINGIDVLKALMSDTHPPRVVMLTAYQSVELAQQATQAGALDYVTKPFSQEKWGKNGDIIRISACDLGVGDGADVRRGALRALQNWGARMDVRSGCVAPATRRPP